MKISELTFDERPMERMLRHGSESLSNAELISIIIRTGNVEKGALDLARDLLASCGESLTVLSATSIERICGVKGIGMSKATSIMAALELGRRFLSEGIENDAPTVNSSEEVFKMMIPKMKGLDHEELWVMFMGKQNRMLGYERLSSGGSESTVIDKRMVLKKALEKSASGIVLVHNHPSGKPTPSKADIVETEALQDSCATFGISIIDHVIITSDSYFSFSENAVYRKKRKTKR